MNQAEVARILRLSDLLIGSGTFTEVVESKLMKRLNEETAEKGDFHYMLFCGNLSADGQKSSFQKASIILKRLAEDFLKDGLERLDRRMLIVPGYFDVGLHERGEPDYSEFKEFYDEFFCNGAEEFNPRQAVLRELRGMTLIGACYHNLPYQHRRRTGDGSKRSRQEELAALERLSKTVDNAVEQANNKIAYCNCTPTLLVTADTPLLTWETRASLATNLDLKKNLETKLRLDLHLFGSADATCIAFEPFAFQHIGLSTGSRCPGELWPMRMNFIEIDCNFSRRMGSKIKVDSGKLTSMVDFDPGYTLAPKAAGSQCFTVRACQLLDESAEWERAPIGRFVKLNKKNQTYTLLHDDLLGKLEPKLDEDAGGMYLVRGLPGSGLDELFQGSAGPHRIGKHLVDVIRCSWKNYSEARPRIKRAYKKAQKAHKKTRKSRKAKNVHKTLVVLSDQAFRNRFVLKRSRNFPFEREIPPDVLAKVENFSSLPVVVLYVLNASDGLKDLLPEHEEELRIGALDPDSDSYRGIVNYYNTELPLDEKRLAYLAGGYAGFSIELISNAKFEFFNSKWDAEPITPRSACCLIDSYESRGCQSLRNPSDALIGFIEQKPYGREIVEYFRDRANEMIHTKEVKAGEIHTKEVKVNESDAEQSPHVFTEKHILNSLLRSNAFLFPVKADYLEAARASISDTLEYLAGYDLLKRIDGRGRRRSSKAAKVVLGDISYVRQDAEQVTYKLRVPVPFLLETNKPVRNVCIFYPSALRSNAEELTEALGAFVKPKPPALRQGTGTHKKSLTFGIHQ